MMAKRVFCRSAAGDDGVAMVLSLLFMLVLSALGTAMLVLSRSETLSSVNYRMMSQARYGAESGVHKAAHYLLNSYTQPGSAGDPLANYDISQSPVRYLGQPVVLSSLSGVPPNYPVAATQTAFASAAQGSLPVGDATVLYSASATLLSMRTVIPYASATPVVVQAWRLTARGTIDGARRAEVEVSAVIERQVVPTYTYGLFATYPGCDSLAFSGGAGTDSYDSSNITLVSGLPQTTLSGGHVATNGGLTDGGGTLVNGSLSTPRTGVGDCSSGTVTAIDLNGKGSYVKDGLIKLPQRVAFSDPDLPSPLPPTTSLVISGSSSCASIPLSSGSCTADAGVITLDPLGTPMSLPNLQVSGGRTLVLNAGTYHVNSLRLIGNSYVKVGTSPVILNVAGVGESTPIDLEGGAISNTSFVSSSFRVLYAGSGTLKLGSGSTQAASIYAPKAKAQIAGGANFYGGIVASTIALSGGSKLHADQELRQYFSVGPQMMSLFTWKEY